MQTPGSLVDAILLALKKEEERIALEVGRGKVAKENRDERIGMTKGLAKALDIVRETARNVESEDKD